MVIRNQAVEKDQSSAHIDFNVDVHLLSCLFFLCNVREQMSCFFFTIKGIYIYSSCFKRFCFLLKDTKLVFICPNVNKV